MPISQDRIKRYIEKINHVKLRTNQIQTWTEDTPITKLVEEPMPLLAIYKAFQEVIEALFDIIAMMCKDTGIPPRDDITNLKSLDAIFKTHHIIHLEALNTLRNKVTHRYNHGEDADYTQLILEGLPNVSEIVKVLQKWLRSQ